MDRVPYREANVTSGYEPQKSLSDLTPEQSRVGKLVQGIFLIEMAWLFGGVLWLGLWSPLVTPGDPGRLDSIVTLATHGILWLSIAVILRAVHNRKIVDLIGPLDQAGEDFRAVLGWTLGILLPLQLLSLFGGAGDNPAVLQPMVAWLVTLPIVLGVILVQTIAEELYFRGYIQSTLAARFARPVIWMGVPSVFFGLLHAQNATSALELFHIVTITALFGLAAADLTARTGALGAAIGLHFSYNTLLLLVANVQGEPFSGLALFLFPVGTNSTDLAEGPFFSFDLIYWSLAILILWLCGRNAVRR